MAEGMMIQYEHVTKMGRVGKALDPHSKKKASPQFRKLPFQDERYFSQARKSSTPEPLSRSRETTQEVYEEGNMSDIPFYDMPDLHQFAADRMKPKAAFTPYVEMKLGRNMRAAPKGSVAGRAPPNNNPQQLENDASEPLLHSQPLPSNLLADYFSNTHSALRLQNDSTAITSKQFPARSMTTPQHPSQDLIEMLNRNNHISQTQSRLEDEQTNAAARQERLEAELRRMQEEDERKQREKEAQAKISTREDTDETPVKSSLNTAADDIVSPPPPPLQNLYGSYRMKEDYESKPSNQFSTQPFTLQDTAGFSKAGMTGDSSPRTATRTGEITVKKQETVEEVEDIQEDIERDKSDEDEDNKIKDDDFNF